jgi:NAD(P)-dependent dehydrogenase (short-subunit alcohol dehydrogenase family)
MGAPDLTMTGKVALITGSRRGIGKAFALAFAEAGADIAICDVTYEGGELETVANEIVKLGRRALPIKADISCKADVDEMVNKTIAELGTIDTLINNAGINPLASVFETDEDTWDRVMDVNVKGYFLCSQAAGRLMTKRGSGNIINMASVNGWKALVNRSAYCVSKAGVIMLTKVLAREFGPHKVRVNALAPYITKTPMMEGFLQDPEITRTRLEPLAMRRFGETNDIIGAALFLASDVASWITGHILVVDGGYLA